MSLSMLNFDASILIGVILIIAFIALAVFLYIIIKRKVNNNYKTAIDYSKIDGKSQLVRHVPFMWPKEVEFYDMLKETIPKSFVIVPKVCVSKVVKPYGSLVLFNAIKDKFVDYVIIKKSNMEPVVVIDCFYPAITDKTIKELDESVKVALKSVNIPILKMEILDEPYDKDKVLKTFLDALDPVTLAQMKKKNEQEK